MSVVKRVKATVRYLNPNLTTKYRKPGKMAAARKSAADRMRGIRSRSAGKQTLKQLHSVGK